MPEGDTLRRAAAVLTPVLENQLVTSVWFRKLRGHRPRVGDRIVSVDAVGKYLLIEFDRRLVLQTHLGMAGSWRASTLDAPVPATPRLRIVLETAAGRALCFSAPSITTHIMGSGTAPSDRIGPDLSDDDFNLDDVVARTRNLAPPKMTVAEMLLDQRIAAGVGNVFKSEALFVARVFPFETVPHLDDGVIGRIWDVAHRQLVANRSRPFRVTTASGDRGGRVFVYGRHRLGCRRCDNAIMFSAAGDRTERSTYWCPTCQPMSNETT